MKPDSGNRRIMKPDSGNRRIMKPESWNRRIMKPESGQKGIDTLIVKKGLRPPYLFYRPLALNSFLKYDIIYLTLIFKLFFQDPKIIRFLKNYLKV